jgi:heme/copper-type cytochrome/quinol oxidase subunit 2
MKLRSLIPQAYAGSGGGNTSPAQFVSVDLNEKLKLGNSTKSVADVYQTPADLINTIVPLMFIAGGIIFFVLIVWGGIKFIQDDQKGPQEAKQIWTIAVTGLIVMFAAFWIVQIIQTLTGTDIRL